MTIAKQGETVAIHYTGTFADGSVFDSSSGRDPLEFSLGSGQIIPDLDAAVTGMEIGASQTVTIPAEEAYGAHNPENVQSVARSQIPSDIPLNIGTQLQAKTPDGQAIPLTVTEITDENVTLDGNHPLAGKVLTFEVQLISIQ